MDIALFPLHAVLFPQGVLPLRVFEPRYMDMVRDCLRDDLPFGVCRIASGSEVGAPAVPEPVGCLARIARWDMQQLGVLQVRAIGAERFRVLQTRVIDRLLRAEVELLPPDADGPVAADHAPCVELLRRIVADLEAQEAREAERAGDAAGRAGAPLAPPYHFDSRVWVGNRLCEVLPVPLKARQRLMELDDAATRLEIVLRYLRQHEIVR